MPSELGLTVCRSFDPQSILQQTLDFSTSPTKVKLGNEYIPRQYQVLTPDRRSSAGCSTSPNSLLDGRATSSTFDEEDSSSSSSSPLSYTKELTSVSSPLTPLSDARRSKSKSPSQLTATNGCRFLADDDEEENENTADLTIIGPELPRSTKTLDESKIAEPLPSTSKQNTSATSLPELPSKNTNDKKNKLSTVFQLSSMKQRTMTIKIGEETMAKKSLADSAFKKPLVDYPASDGESSSDEEEKTPQAVKGKPKVEAPPSPRTIIGPLKPSKVPVVKLEPINTLKRNGDASTSTPPVTKRKRLLSERGEKEFAYPIMDKTTVSAWNWGGCSSVMGRSRGSGLHNSSNDCFLNAILQIITHTAPLCRYILERHPNETCARPSGQCVCCTMRLNHLKRSLGSNSPFAASWIRPHLRRIFPSHMHGMQEDAHELLALLLDALDPPISNNKAGVPNGLTSLKPSTPVEQIFGGTLRNQVTCNNCSIIHTNYERIRELNLAIKKRPDSDCSRISYLIEHYFRDESLSSFDCKKCARKTTATRKTRVLRPPAVLLVQLKRFNAFGGKIRLPVTADMDVDLSRFMQEGLTTSLTSAQYVLTAVVEHLGSGVDHGHYVAYCRGFDHKQWFLFDDESVQGVSGQKVVGSQPYLLVYSRREDLNLAPTKVVDGTAFQKALGAQKSNGYGPRVNHSNGNGNINRGYNNGYSSNGMNKKFNSGFNPRYKLI